MKDLNARPETMKLVSGKMFQNIKMGKFIFVKTHKLQETKAKVD
jgi:hypothetical protein